MYICYHTNDLLICTILEPKKFPLSQFLCALLKLYKKLEGTLPLVLLERLSEDASFYSLLTS